MGKVNCGALNYQGNFSGEDYALTAPMWYVYQDLVSIY